MNASSPVKINTVAFKEWITAINYYNELLQGIDGCNYSGEISRLALKNRMPKIGFPEQGAVLNRQPLSQIICSI